MTGETQANSFFISKHFYNVLLGTIIIDSHDRTINIVHKLMIKNPSFESSCKKNTFFFMSNLFATAVCLLIFKRIFKIILACRLKRECYKFIIVLNKQIDKDYLPTSPTTMFDH